MGNKLKWYYSWGVIVLAMLCFWPLGVLLLLGRSKAERKLSFRITKLLKGVAIAWLVVVIMAVLNDPSDSELLLGGVVLAIPSILVLRYSRKQKKKTELTKKYIDVIVNGGERQLDNIASAVGVTYDVACKQIQEMIDKGYFKNTYLNVNERVVVTNTTQAEMLVEKRSEAVNVQTENVQQTRVVKCETCGANNTIYGSVGECEYCGSPLK